MADTVKKTKTAATPVKTPTKAPAKAAVKTATKAPTSTMIKTATKAAPKVPTNGAVKTAKKNGKVAQSTRPALPPREEIERLARSYWAQRGYQDGYAEQDWLRAEQELLQMAS